MDRTVLLWVNHLSAPHLDAVMRTASNSLVLFVLLCCAVLLLLSRLADGRAKALLLVAAVAVTDIFNVGVVKPLAPRQRPCWTEPVRTVVACGSNESMPSNHAATTSAAAVVVIWALPSSAAAVVPLVLLVGTARVYLAAHYPSDILVGWLLGLAIGLLTIGAGYATGLVRDGSNGPESPPHSSQTHDVLKLEKRLREIGR